MQASELKANAAFQTRLDEEYPKLS